MENNKIKKTLSANGLVFGRGEITHITGFHKTAKTTLAVILAAELAKGTGINFMYANGANSKAYLNIPAKIVSNVWTETLKNKNTLVSLLSWEQQDRLDCVIFIAKHQKPDIIILDDIMDFVTPLTIESASIFVDKLYRLLPKIGNPHIIAITHDPWCSYCISSEIQQQFQRKSRTTITMNKKNSSECVGIVDGWVNETKKILINTETKVCQYSK